MTGQRGAGHIPTLLAYASRDRARALVREAFPRKRWRVVITRSSADAAITIRRLIVDATLVDLVAAEDDSWRACALAQDFPSIPFFALVSARSSDSAIAARCAALGFADVLVEGIDDSSLRHLVAAQTYSARFSRALAEAPEGLGFSTELQRRSWRAIVRQAGAPVTTTFLAEALNVSREHLSRHFSRGGAPNLKRVIDLVRLIAAAELSKNPGYDVRDISRVLGFASSSHLSIAAQRIFGIRPAALARLRTVDLLERFIRGRTRSRAKDQPT